MPIKMRPKRAFETLLLNKPQRPLPGPLRRPRVAFEELLVFVDKLAVGAPVRLRQVAVGLARLAAQLVGCQRLILAPTLSAAQANRIIVVWTR